MATPESERYTFIVRFSRQPREIESEPPVWHIAIEDVAGGQRHYFLTFHEMVLFMIDNMQLREQDLQVLMRSNLPPKVD